MLHVGVVLLAAYFCITSLWWLTQTTARFYHARQRHVDFKTSITFPCCSNCRSQPVDGILKIAFAGISAFAEFSLDKGYDGDDAFLSRMELGSIFVFLLLSGAMDVLGQWGSRTFYQYAEFAGLVLFFTATAVILQSHSLGFLQPLSSLHSLAAYLAIASAVITVVEALYPDQVLCPLTRSYLLLLQGTWWLHAAVVLHDDTLMTGVGLELTTHAVVLLSIMFSGHAALNFVIVVCLWLLVGKLVEKSGCGCAGGASQSPNEDGVFLENRVRFNYHVLSRFDSDSE